MRSSSKLYSGMCLAVVLLVLSAVIPLTYTSRPKISALHTVLAPGHHSRPVTLVSLKRSSSESSADVIDQTVPSTGCGVPLEVRDATASDVSIVSNGQQRSYRLYVPAGFTNSVPHALVLNFHGYGADGHIEEEASNFDAVASAHNFIVAYPDGLFGPTGERGWNTGLHPGVTANDTLYVSNLLDQLQSNFCIQPTQIYATGLSNGGGFVNLLACTMSDRIAAFAPISGSYVTPAEDCYVKRPVPIIEFHGTADSVNPYDGDTTKREPPVAHWLMSWLNRDGCDSNPSSVDAASTTTTVYTWSACKDGAVLVHYKIYGGQHMWPNGLFKETIAGTTNMVDAAAIIWQFFSVHSLG